MNEEQRLKRIQEDNQPPEETVHLLDSTRYRKKAYHDSLECYQLNNKSTHTLTRGEAQDRGHWPCTVCVLGDIGKEDRGGYDLLCYELESDVELSEVRELSLEELVERVKGGG